MNKAVYPLKQNWHLFQPYLDDADVVAVLNERMNDFIAQHYPYGTEWDVETEGPWTLTTSDYWMTVITERVEADPDYQTALDDLYRHYAKRMPMLTRMTYGTKCTKVMNTRS